MHRCGWRNATGSGCEKPLEDAQVDVPQGVDCGEIHVLVDFVNRGGHRTELDHLGTEFGDEAPVGGAAGRAYVWNDAGNVLDCSAQDLDQLAPRREIGRPGKRPFESVVEPMAIEYRLDACFQLLRRARRGEAEIEHDLHFTGDDVGCAGTPVDIRDLPGGGRKVFVATIPFGGGELRERRYDQVHRILPQMRVGDMTLHAFHPQRGRERTASAVLDGVAQLRDAGRLAD